MERMTLQNRLQRNNRVCHMKIEKVRKIISVMRVVAPEFKDKTEDELRIWIEIAEPYISESRFGGLYPQAIAYLAAHKMTLNAPAVNQEGKISVSLKDFMNIASFSEGSTSVSFNNPAAATGSASGADAEYLLTAYGLQFLAIRKQCIVPITISGMKRR